jgi:hypothetical protein
MWLPLLISQNFLATYAGNISRYLELIKAFMIDVNLVAAPPVWL